MNAPAPTDYEIGRDNIQFLGLDVHPVFFVSSLTILAFVAGHRLPLRARDDRDVLLHLEGPAGNCGLTGNGGAGRHVYCAARLTCGRRGATGETRR